MNTVFNIILLPIFIFYQLLVLLRNVLYDLNIFKATKLDCRVISVGNITTGGTGKTPTVIALAKYFKSINISVAILSRGYGRSSRGTQLVTDGSNTAIDWQTVGDEPALMANQLNEIPIVVDENRARGGQYLINNFNPQLIILDDAFQHRKLFRDVDIVTVSGKTPNIGNSVYGFTNIREPRNSLKRADIIFLSKSNLIENYTKLKDKLSAYKNPLFETTIEPAQYLISKDGKRVDINQFIKKTGIIFSGIADPQSFIKTSHKIGIEIVGSIIFSDHKNYMNKDIKRISAEFLKTEADIILTTEKDLVKISNSDLPIYAIPMKILINSDAVKQIEQLLNPAMD